MTPELESALDRLAPITLSELEGDAALRERRDRKYLTRIDAVSPVVERLGTDYRALEIDGSRASRYESVYFDTPDFLCYRAHRQGRRLRFKARTRHYVDSGICLFEVKLRSKRGVTLKRSIPYAEADLERVTPAALTFLHDCLGEHYGATPPIDLGPVLRTRYQRTTLVELGGAVRMTLDFGTEFESFTGGRSTTMDPGLAIAETKTLGKRTSADDALQAFGSRPRRLSKYCAGLALTDAVARPNWLLPALRMAFPVPSA
jgi:hypothetical protein